MTYEEAVAEIRHCYDAGQRVINVSNDAFEAYCAGTKTHTRLGTRRGRLLRQSTMYKDATVYRQEDEQ